MTGDTTPSREEIDGAGIALIVITLAALAIGAWCLARLTFADAPVTDNRRQR